MLWKSGHNSGTDDALPILVEATVTSMRTEPDSVGVSGLAKGSAADGRLRSKALVVILTGIALVALVAAGVTKYVKGLKPMAVAGMMQTWSDNDVIEVQPPSEKCSHIGANCAVTKCCRYSGYQCFEKNASWAGCLQRCMPGQENGGEDNRPPVFKKGKPDSNPPPHSVPFFAAAPKGPWTCNRPMSLVPLKPAIAPPGTTLYCWMVALEKKAGKKTKQFDLVRTQLRLHAGIFGCEGWTVFSDVETWLSPGPPKMLNTVKIDFPKVAKRPYVKAAVNALLFVNAWREIQRSGLWKTHDWTVKSDPGTVFLPMRLRSLLKDQKITANGVYLSNCKWVRETSFHGALEVISNVAAGVMAHHAQDCLSNLPWNAGTHQHFRYYGEDQFAQKCMDYYGVDDVPSRYEVGMTSSSDPGALLLASHTCPAHVPKELWFSKKNKGLSGKGKTWYPDCATTKTAAIFDFEKPEKFFTCLAATQRGDGIANK